MLLRMGNLSDQADYPDASTHNGRCLSCGSLWEAESAVLVLVGNCTGHRLGFDSPALFILKGAGGWPTLDPPAPCGCPILSAVSSRKGWETTNFDRRLFGLLRAEGTLSYPYYPTGRVPHPFHKLIVERVGDSIPKPKFLAQKTGHRQNPHRDPPTPSANLPSAPPWRPTSIALCKTRSRGILVAVGIANSVRLRSLSSDDYRPSIGRECLRYRSANTSPTPRKATPQTSQVARLSTRPHRCMKSLFMRSERGPERFSVPGRRLGVVSRRTCICPSPAGALSLTHP